MTLAIWQALQGFGGTIAIALDEEQGGLQVADPISHHYIVVLCGETPSVVAPLAFGRFEL